LEDNHYTNNIKDDNSMKYNFDQVIERRGTDGVKWHYYELDVLPLWVADMDFPSPEPIIKALQERAAHGIFGYALPPLELSEILCERMNRLHQWQINPEEIMFLPGLVSGLNLVCRAMGRPGEGVLVQTPVYPPFLTAPANHDLKLETARLTHTIQGQTLHYDIDFEIFENAISPETRLFILCNPHNPVGRSYNCDELTQLAEICLRHDLVICSDEIHCDLLMGDTRHIPIASLAPEIADRTITLVAPSKTFNIPGLGCSFAIIRNPELRQRMEKAAAGIIPHVNIMGYVAALAAYNEGNEWLEQLLAYLTANRDFVVDFVAEHLPGIRTTVPESTYLAWLDCREANIDGNSYEFFLKKAKVALNDGARFGAEGEGFVRLNYGCPRSILQQALEQMQAALAG
jgi:cystathionine beta-lyase